MIFLEDIKGPEDLKKLTHQELRDLAEELRETIIKTVSQCGGHLASSLGVVELTLAMHYVFNSPTDKIVWDVGHQSYPHKLLTGRLPQFHTLRKSGGLGGFPRRSESPHDAFDTGHSSTSISVAAGMAEARDLKGEKNKVIAVIGDGALTAGLALEGLNHAGHLRKDLIVILNDNEMSISPNVGALSLYLNRILTGDTYKKFRSEARQLLESIPKLGGTVAKFAGKAEESLKGLLLPGVLFEELGFNYVGPIDGHNIEVLIDTLNKVKTLTDRPVLMHVITKKGKGYGFSEDDPCGFHGVGPFEPDTGSQVSSAKGPKVLSYSDVFGAKLTELAEKDPRIVAITAAMKEGTGLAGFAEKHPRRFYDVGIAEPHAVTFAAGMSAEGMRPVVAIYSTFLQRSYDEIIHDVCLQGLPVVFAIDRAGIVGEDGPTHQGVFDISFLRHIPNLICMAPKDAEELRQMLALAFKLDQPCAIRYPRGKAVESETAPATLELGRAEVLLGGTEAAILAIGNTVLPSLEAAKKLKQAGIEVAVVNMRFVKPLDTTVIDRMAESTGHIITLEENALQGGFGSAVAEYMASSGSTATLHMHGLPDNFIEQGSQAELRRKYGLDAQGIQEFVSGALRNKTLKH